MYQKINRRDFMHWIWRTGLYTSLYSFMGRSRLAHGSPWAFIYRKNEGAVVTFKTHPDNVRKMVPKPLQANDKGIMVASFASMHKVEPIFAKNDYYTSSLSIPVVYEGKRGFGHVRKEGLFFVNFFSDSATPVSFARRTWGYPSKMAKISWLATEDIFKSSITKNEEKIARIKMNIANESTNIYTGSDVYHFNLIKRSSYNELAIFKCRNEEQERFSSRIVEANLFGIDIKSIVSAFYRKFDFYITSEPEIVKKIPRE
jgi:hypothetical protein